jgi:hypothetical protein
VNEISQDTARKLRNACHLMMGCFKQNKDIIIASGYYEEWAYGKALEATQKAEEELGSNQLTKKG